MQYMHIMYQLYQYYTVQYYAEMKSSPLKTIRWRCDTHNVIYIMWYTQLWYTMWCTECDTHNCDIHNCVLHILILSMQHLWAMRDHYYRNLFFFAILYRLSEMFDKRINIFFFTVHKLSVWIIDNWENCSKFVSWLF